MILRRFKVPQIRFRSSSTKNVFKGLYGALKPSTVHSVMCCCEAEKRDNG